MSSDLTPTTPPPTKAQIKAELNAMNKKQKKGGPMKPLTPQPVYIAPTPDPLQVCRVTDPGNVAQTFRELVSQTCPSGEEAARFAPLMLSLGCTADGLGNWYKQIGQSDTMFTSHLDDVSRVRQNVTLLETKGLTHTDGKTILGADCKAGVAVMLYMMHLGVPGVYAFFREEEIGRLGSEAAAKRHSLPMRGIKKVVSFDRREYQDIITHQGNVRTCSDAFAQALADELNDSPLMGPTWKPDDTGSYTDSLAFAKLVPECTNLSVGYHHAHSKTESVDLGFVTRLAQACAVIDWTALPAERDPDAVEEAGPLTRVLAATLGVPVSPWDLLDLIDEESYLVAEWLATIINGAPQIAQQAAQLAEEEWHAEQRMAALRRSSGFFAPRTLSDVSLEEQEAEDEELDDRDIGFRGHTRR